MEPIIDAHQIKKTFGDGEFAIEALKGVDLKLNPNELLMIVGPSGSGKTTLISILAGILKPTTGNCSLLGKDLLSLDNSHLTSFRKEHVGFVFQAFNLIPMLTASENVSVPLVLQGVDRTQAIEQADRLLIDFGMEDKLREYPVNLSGGQQQRVAIARSVIHNPNLIVCDEPTSNLDGKTGAKVVELLKSQITQSSETGRSLIIVTHDERIFPYADRVVELVDGMIVS